MFSVSSDDVALYVHWPFCASKCPYCDFNSHVSDSIDHDLWVARYLAEIDRYADEMAGRKIVSIYFGGGTPSLMKPSSVAAIIDRVQARFSIVNDIEITLEANPTSVEMEKFADFRQAGVNRVSLGVQALNDEDLKFLGRKHSVDEAVRALEIAKANFDRVNFDLIYARPEQSLKDWEQELDRAVEYAAGHLSLYQLTIERNTPFYMSHAKGDFSLPKEELAADFYGLTQDVLEGAGLVSYEVSNHATAGQESRHNLMYWHYGDYIGIGPGAHGRVSLGGGDGGVVKYATRAHGAPQIWLDGGGDVETRTVISKDDQMLERLMMGLRVRSGIGIDPVRPILDEGHVQTAVDEGWIVLEHDESGQDIICTTREGVLRLNALLDYLTV